MNPFTRVYLGDPKTPVHTTPKVKHTIQPVWESATEFLCPDRTTSVITVKVIDDRDFLKDPVVGYATSDWRICLTHVKRLGRTGGR